MISFELLLTILFVIMIYLIKSNNINSCNVIGISSLFVLFLWVSNINIEDAFNKYIIPKSCNRKLLYKKDCERRENLEIQPKPEIYLNSESRFDLSNSELKTNPEIRQSGTPINNIVQTDASYNLDDDTIKNKILDARLQSKKLPVKKVKPISERPMPLEYSENNYKYNLFDEIGSLGDNNIAHLMKHLSNKNRVAIDNMARQNKYTNINYFAEELNDHANSIWWDDETLEKEF